MFMIWNEELFIRFIHPEKSFEDPRVTGKIPKFQTQTTK